MTKAILTNPLTKLEEARRAYHKFWGNFYYILNNGTEKEIQEQDKTFEAEQAKLKAKVKELEDICC